MGNPYLKHIARSRPYKRAKLFLKRLVGKELWLHEEINIETATLGDWRFEPRCLNAGSVVYSLGVGDNIDFDLGLITLFGCEVHAFDPTPSVAAWLSDRRPPAGFHFHPWAIAGSDGTLTLYPRVRRDGSMSKIMYTHVPVDLTRRHGLDVPALTIPSAMKRLGHQQVDLLKMDIEGAEYEVLETLSSPLPTQLLVEFHHRFPGIGVARTAEAIDRLRMNEYRIMAVSETGREVSFLRQQASAA